MSRPAGLSPSGCRLKPAFQAVTAVGELGVIRFPLVPAIRHDVVGWEGEPVLNDTPCPFDPLGQFPERHESRYPTFSSSANVR